MIKQLVPEVYDPQFVPQKLDLNEFIESREKDEQAQAKVASYLQTSPLIKLLTSGDLPKPLTFEEAEAIDDEIKVTQDAIKTTRGRIASILNRIDEVGAGSGNEISFKLDISKKNQLKRAVRQVFGLKTDTITYSMYKAALEAKKTLEKDEASDYVNLNWKK